MIKTNKIALILLAGLLLMPNFMAIAEVRPPEWKEFCPQAYLNSEYDKNVYYTYGAKEVLRALSIVGIPWNVRNWHKHLNQQENNYWVSRRYAFKNELATCQNEPNAQAICYLKIREMEDNKTAQHQNQAALTNINNNIIRLKY